MVAIPENVMALLKDPEAKKTISTVCPGNRPHTVTAGTIGAVGDSQMMVGEILMKRTAQNLAKNPNASFAVFKGTEAYEIHCVCKEQVKSGPLYDGVKAVCDKMNLPLSSVFVFDVISVYNQSASMEAGKKIA
jgi:hypothetical protein